MQLLVKAHGLYASHSYEPRILDVWLITRAVLYGERKMLSFSVGIALRGCRTKFDAVYRGTNAISQPTNYGPSVDWRVGQGTCNEIKKHVSNLASRAGKEV